MVRTYWIDTGKQEKTTQTNHACHSGRILLPCCSRCIQDTTQQNKGEKRRVNSLST